MRELKAFQPSNAAARSPAERKRLPAAGSLMPALFLWFWPALSSIVVTLLLDDHDLLVVVTVSAAMPAVIVVPAALDDHRSRLGLCRRRDRQGETECGKRRDGDSNVSHECLQCPFAAYQCATVASVPKPARRSVRFAKAREEV